MKIDALAAGQNPLANTTEQARQEAEEAPPSPMRQPTPQQEAQTAAERGESTVAPIPPEVNLTEEQMRELDQQAQEADQVPLPDDDDAYLD